MGFSRQEYWSGLPFPSPDDLPDPGIEPASFTSAALAGRFFTASTTWEADSLESTTRTGFRCFVKGLQSKAYIFKLDNFVFISFQITFLITVYNHDSHLCDENFA